MKTINVLFILALSTTAYAARDESRLRGAPAVLESDVNHIKSFENVYAKAQSEASTTCVDYGGICNTNRDCC